jgi:hypothetical protein
MYMCDDGWTHIQRYCETISYVHKKTLAALWVFKGPVPVASQSKAWVCGRSPAEIVGSNPTEDMDVCLLLVLCVVR